MLESIANFLGDSKQNIETSTTKLIKKIGKVADVPTGDPMLPGSKPHQSRNKDV